MQVACRIRADIHPSEPVSHYIWAYYMSKQRTWHACQGYLATILSLKRADLLVNGTSLYSVLLNASLNWPISSSALSESLCNSISFPPLLVGEVKWRGKGGNTLSVCLSFFSYLCICRSLWDLPLHHLPSYSHTNHAAFLMSAFISLFQYSNLVRSLPLPVFLALAWFFSFCKSFFISLELKRQTY